MKKLIPFIVFNFILLTAFSQIVNIERERYQTYFVFSTSAHIQYKSKKHLYLLLGSADLLKTKA